MSGLPRLANFLLAAALSLLLGAELLLPDRVASLSPRSVAVQAPVNAAPPDPEIGQWADTVLARPLFNADRRPVQEASPDVGTALPRLSAIIISGGTSRAIFAGSGPLPKVVSAGGQIDGYEIEAILPDAVKLAGPSGRLTLRLQFRSAAPGDTPATAPANAPSITSNNPPPPPIPTAASRLDDDPI